MCPPGAPFVTSAISLKVLGSAGSDSTQVHKQTHTGFNNQLKYTLVLSHTHASRVRWLIKLTHAHTHSPGQLAETQNSLVGEVTDVNLREKTEKQKVKFSVLKKQKKR